MKSRVDRCWRKLSQSVLEHREELTFPLAVLAAHPDDETIGASVLLSRCSNSRVIFLTDGAPRDRRLWSPEFQGTREEYQSLRRGEAEQALSLGRIPRNQITWMGATDQESIFTAGDLACELANLLTKSETAILVTHPYEGGHPDHDTAALIARIAISLLPPDIGPALVEMTSYHAKDGQCITGCFLDNGSTNEIVVKLSVTERARKVKMFSAYRSQSRVLGAFGGIEERFRLAPEYDFSATPQPGKLWYECIGWPMTGEHWRSLAAMSMARMQEQACR
jgi:N-acetylglucosamine malate deacetylase 2